VPRTPDPQPSETPATSPTRRRLALGIAGLALVPVGILAGCGNAQQLQRTDTRPEPNASTEGVRSVYPTAPPPVPEGPIVVPHSGPPSPALDTPAP
jgi:hypothetical protein